MLEVADFFVKIGVTGPAALFAFAAGFMIYRTLARQDRDIETNVTLANAITQLSQAVLANRETLQRIEQKVSK